MDAVKKEFLQHRLVTLLRKIPSDKPAQWGKMTLQQMVEHFAESVRIASGKLVMTKVLTPPEHLEKMRDFLMSEKPFRENTKNALMSEVPAPVINPSLELAINELQEELDFFFTVFEKNRLQVTRNPFFGDLNYEQNVQLLHKHALHHLRQFGVTL
jgi:hypothetical protein